MRGILAGNNTTLSRADAAAILRWAIYNELEQHEAVRDNIRFEAPDTFKAAIREVEELKKRLETESEEHENALEQLNREHLTKIEKLEKAMEEAGVTL